MKRMHYYPGCPNPSVGNRMKAEGRFDSIMNPCIIILVTSYPGYVTAYYDPSRIPRGGAVIRLTLSRPTGPTQLKGQIVKQYPLVVRLVRKRKTR